MRSTAPHAGLYAAILTRPVPTKEPPRHAPAQATSSKPSVNSRLALLHSEYDLATSHRLPAFVEKAGAAVLETLNAAFQAGYEQGRADLHDAIMRAVEANKAPGKTSANAVVPGGTINARAPRGAVRQAIVAALSSHPEGLTERQLAIEMRIVDPKVSGRSAGGELRRRLGRLYDRSGDKWFLTARDRTRDYASREAMARHTIVPPPPAKELPTIQK